MRWHRPSAISTRITPNGTLPDQRPAFTVLDLGTTYVKALVVTTDGQRGEVWGVGRHRLRGMRGARIADVAAVAMACETALCHAENMTTRTCGVTLVPDRAVVGLAGSAMHILITPAKTQRPRPDERVRPEEAAALTERAVRLARAQAEQGGPVEMIQAEPLSITVDGHRVSDVSRLRGQELGLSLFAAFIPQTQVSALERLRRRLELDVALTLAGPFAMAVQAREDGLFIDLGGTSTDLTLVRAGQLAAAAHLPSGGAAFDRALAHHLNITPARAEWVKLTYQAGQLAEPTAQEVAAICQREAALWLDSLGPLLRRLNDPHPLPANIWLCGGGSNLEEVFQASRDVPWMQRFDFARYPQVRRLEPADLTRVLDRTGGQLTRQDIPALALAQAALARIAGT